MFKISETWKTSEQKHELQGQLISSCRPVNSLAMYKAAQKQKLKNGSIILSHG